MTGVTGITGRTDLTDFRHGLTQRARRLAKVAAVVAATVACAGTASAQPGPAWPAGMSFVAQDVAGVWRLHQILLGGHPTVLPTQLEPRQACVAAAAGVAVYAAADGTLRRLDASSGVETILARNTARHAYTQPCLSADGRDIYAVEMADGKSVETEIVRLSVAAEPVRIARQIGAQHDPFIHQGRHLVYGHVGCSEGCDTLLVEIWLRDLVAGTTRQLTLLNALSQSPVTDGRRVVFSSNASGSFQLWQVGLDGGGLRQLTQGPPQALQPALCGGEIFLLRTGPQGSAIARLSADGAVSELAVPGLRSFRALRCLQ